ncbi:hypothetical protein ABFS82_06G119600 [Erythranthe guttata]|uniref:Sulfotransferase n=1 Tax=Erythranthe guttata TaxID=4155 RepID=A0A022R8E0_ERYGU|nr:PREDICTED: cytosolic sulfotransferase 13-like [Erythranthe guttata]EYU35155.1 hypothetical protein MIMGU_mgv1a024172mg [Erythranthe guttata]|eukprot:XP_012839940.1 PREDICTED: cytosolic sulfotransferase 13-like [Erythranthe guttata]
MPDLSSSQITKPLNNIVEKSLLINELPRSRFWETMDICQWEGFWFEPSLVGPAMTFRSTFHARDDDVLLASTMKTGTTWLKSLSLSIITQNRNRRQTTTTSDILTSENPHYLVPTIESTMYSTKPLQFDPYDSSDPRLLHTHLPYSVLPDSVKNGPCKIVYIARNPKDTVISMWHFFNSILQQEEDPFPMEKAVDCFCSGVHQYGSFFDHVREYWVESKKRPDKILFVKYEELKTEPKRHVSKIAEFLGRPFGDGDEGALVEEVLSRCCLERLKNLEVNKNGSVLLNVPNSSFFRKGEVGGWKNYLTAEMEEMIDQTSRIKLEPFGLFL